MRLELVFYGRAATHAARPMRDLHAGQRLPVLRETVRRERAELEVHAGARLAPRLGLAAGISYASRIPFTEQRDQALRGRDTSKLLLYLDPTVDLSVGSLFGVRELRETYFGIGASHRSGIFGSSRLFNSVDGGSNYNYAFIESAF